MLPNVAGKYHAQVRGLQDMQSLRTRGYATDNVFIAVYWNRVVGCELAGCVARL